MRTETLCCDRCRRTIKLTVSGWYGDSPTYDQQGWWTFPTFNDDGATIAIEDACPNCITDGERADRLFAEVEADVLLGNEEPA